MAELDWCRVFRGGRVKEGWSEERTLKRALAAALVGGLTSIWGGFLAGVLLGVVEAFIDFKSPVTGVSEVVLAAFIIVMLLVRPAGLVRSAY